jgi:putative flippase GtrA
MRRQIVTYLGVGIACMIIDVGLMQALILLSVNYVVATTAGFLAGLFANFALHTRVTFRSAPSVRVAAKYLAVVLASYLLTVAFVWLAQTLFRAPVIGKLVALPFVAAFAFVMYRTWVYKSDSGASS